MKKRVTSLLLTFCMLLSMTAQNIGYVWAAENPPASVSVEYEGSEITDIIVPQNEKKTVTAVCDPSGDLYDHQWQVLIDLQADLWVNITGQSEQSLDLSYALLSSVLDVSGSGYIRCAVNIGEETVYSKPVCVTISFTPEIAFEPTPSEQPVRQNYALRADDGHAEYVYITVNYIDAVSGNQLFGSHTSKIQAGTTFSEIVHSPTFLGFAPYYYSDKWDKDKNDVNKDTTDQKNTDNPENANTTAKNAGTINFGTLLNNEPVEKNITINVYYWAIDVPYAVRYFYQNINDDYYTEQTNLYYVSKAKTGTIIEDKELFEHAGNPVGFSALYHYPENVAADGSTVFECYYDRNYYFMKFDMNGGYGVEPIYARYDTPIVVNNPTRHGYTFLGWDELERNSDGTYSGGDGIADSIPERISTENKYYKALWEKANTTYTVIYWLSQPDDDGYAYLGYNKYDVEAEENIKVNTNLEDAIGVKDDPVRLATLDYFTLNTSKSDKTVYVKGDGSTIANVYYDRKEYTLKYYYAREYIERGSTHRQICGNTSNFSDQDKNGNGTTNISTLLSYVNGNWSDVTQIPALQNNNGYYQTGAEKIRHNNIDYTYYYFTITGKYGCNLTDKWPLEVLEKATLVNSKNGTKDAYFSAWNPEHHIFYGQHSADFNNNRTIKGTFQKLDRRILYEKRFGADSNGGELRFLAFWTNSCPGANWDTTRRWIYKIYLEDIDGNRPQTPTHTYTTYDTNDAANEQTPTSIVGFSLSETTSRLNIGTFGNRNQIHEINFYYDRLEYDLSLYNLNKHWGETKIPFDLNVGELLQKDTDKIIPKYPETLEQGAYYFEGWYTTADCTNGSGFLRYNKDKDEWYTGKAYFNKMPASHLILYAHWAPISHEVRFFKTYQNLLNYEESQDDSWIFNTTTQGVQNNKVFGVDHGNVVGTVDFPTYEENGQSLEFAGWFYMNNGVKMMFTPADMPVRRDLDIFADWGSHFPQPYRIQYMEYGTEKKLADDTFGYAYQGSTRTFLPKAGSPFNQLYDGYNSGWYPTLSSHSITIKAEEDKENLKENIYTFYYVHTDNLPYMVRYVDKQTGTELGRDIHETNTNAVVTERFKPIEGMVPDAFYKRLVLSVKFDENDQASQNPEDNVITFYYTPSDTTAFYAIHYMLQKPGTDGNKDTDFVESNIHTEGTGDIGQTITISPIVQTGYTVREDAVIIYGGDNSKPDPVKLKNNSFQFEVKQEGTELYVYYSLREYNYTVKYLEHGTNKEVHKPKIVNGKQYGAVVQEDAITVGGYTAVDPTTKFLTIRDHDEDSGKDDPNVIIFYYVPKTYVAEYKVTGDIGGTLDNQLEKVAGQEGVYSFKGSVPTPNEGFEFVGWYKDAACRNPVNAEWIAEGNKLIPQVDDMKPEPAVNTYYAKFRELKGDLTITRSNAEDEGNGDQVFVYKVINKDDPSLTIYVSITGAGSETIHGLRYGTYTVEQMNDWSWRYSDGTCEVTHNKNGSTVEFNQSADKKQWLNGNSPVAVNVRGINP